MMGIFNISIKHQPYQADVKNFLKFFVLYGDIIKIIRKYNHAATKKSKIESCTCLFIDSFFSLLQNIKFNILSTP